MKENKTVYELKIGGDIEDLQKVLNKAKKSLEGLGDSNFTAGIDKKLSSVLGQLDKLKKKASRPLGSKSAFTALENGFSDIVEDAKNLFVEMGKISKLTTKEKLSLLPEDEAKKFKDALNAVAAYDRAIEKLERNRLRAQEKRKSDKVSTTNALGQAKEEYKNKKNELTAATSSSTKYGEAKAIVERAEAAKKAQKEIDSLEKQLKKYQKRLEELNSVETKTIEQENEIATVRSNIKSIGGKIGSRRKVVNSGPDEKTLGNAEKTVEAETPAIRILEDEVERTEKEVTHLTNTLAKLDEAIQNNGSEIKTSQSDYKILYEQARKLGIGLEGITEDVSAENVHLLQTRMRELVEQGVKPLDDALDELAPDFEKIEDGARKAGEGVREGLESWSNQSENDARVNNIKENIRRFIGWAGASKVLGAALRNAFADIKELDAAMTEIAVVTDFDIGDMWEQMPQYTARANELGLAITEVYEASALFYQQGLDTNEMMALSNETLKMAKIAGLDAAEATDRMTAALRGFNMELDEASAQKVADVYSELAAITASDVDEISSAMTKTASIASSAGMEFETTAAFLSQIIETTRESAETAGTAMKTVIARFQELKKSPDEIGEIDGEMVDANAIEGALRSVGVSLRDAGGQFRELDDVFLELSSKWDGLDKNTQRYIATIAAGSRQQSRFIAMMQDYGRTQELVAAANGSAGASQRQYEKTLESLRTKLKKLDNAWTEFSTGLMNSDIVKFAVDFLTSLLNALNRVTEGFGGLTGSLSKAGTMIAIFQTAKAVVGKFFDEIIAKVYLSAVKAGESIAQGTEDGINKKKQPETESNGLFGRKKLSKGFGQLKEAKNKKNLAKFEEDYYKQEAEEAKKYWGENSKEAIAAIEEYEAAKKDTIQVEKEADQIAQEGLKNIAEGAQTAAQAITMIGAGLGVVGQMFSEMGMEEVGEGFQTAGNAITFVGSALMAIVPIISLLGTTFTVAGEKISLAGLMAQIGWWPLLLIALAIAAVVTTIILVADAIKKASPEYKLEQAQEAADKAADAADRAAESYENLTNAFDELETGYEALKNLTRGTEEWDKAVKNINNSVLDLIQQYPELAKFVDNEGGVLTINMDDTGVQQVLKEAETSAVVAKNSATLANLNVTKAENDLAYKNLDDDAKFNLGGAHTAYGGAMAGSIVSGVGAGAGIGALIGNVIPIPGIGAMIGAGVGAGIGAAGGLVGGFFTGEAAKNAALEDTQSITEALAKAIADGAIIDNGSGYDVKSAEKLAKYGLKTEDLSDYYVQVGDSTEALRDFGEQLLQTNAQEEVAFAAVATSAYQLANTMRMSAEEQSQAANLVDEASVKQMYQDNLDDLQNINFTDEKAVQGNTKLREQRDEAIRAQYGADARIEGNRVTYRDIEGKQWTEELTNDEIKAMIANNITTQETKKAIELAPETLDHVISEMGFEKDSAEARAIEAAALDQEGGNLTANQASILANMSEKELRKVYEQMSQEQKDVFGTAEDYVSKIKGVGEIASGAFEDAGEKAKKIGLITVENEEKAADKFSEAFGFMTSDMAKGFAEKMEGVWNATGEEGVKAVQEAYNTLLEGKDDETAQKITARMNAVDWTNQKQLLALEIELEEKYGYTRKEAQALTNTMADAARATSNLTTTVEIFGDFYHATEKLNAQLEKTADLQWKYERMLKNGAEATKLAANLEEQRQSILASGYQALDAYEAARADQAKVYASGVNLPGVDKDVTQYVKFDSNTGAYDLTELQRQLNANAFGAEGTDSRKAVEDYVSKLTEANNLAEDQLDEAKKSYEQLEELNEAAEEAYISIYEQIGDLITTEMEKEIAVQQGILDATTSANERLINKLQEQIDEERQARKNEEAKENIADLRDQTAYLGMDTSGANTLSILDLEKQIAEDEEAYQDSLIDQSIQSLQDANDKAAEQRERQIAISEQQLEAYKNSADYQLDIQGKLSQYMTEYQQTVAEGKDFDVKNTQLGAELIEAGFLDGMSQFAEEAFWEELTANTAKGVTWYENNVLGTAENGAVALLAQIVANTGTAEINIVEAQQQFAAAEQTAKSLYETYGIDLPSFKSYTSTTQDGEEVFDFKTAKTDIINMNNAGEKKANLNNRNNQAKNELSKFSNAEGLQNDKILTLAQFQSSISQGNDIEANGKIFNKTNLTNDLIAEDEELEYDYYSYVQAKIAERYAESDEKEYLEEQFENAIQSLGQPIRKDGEIAFRGWETVSNRKGIKEIVDAYAASGGDIETLKQKYSDQYYQDGPTGAVSMENTQTEGDVLPWEWFDTIHHFYGTVPGYGTIYAEYDYKEFVDDTTQKAIEQIVGENAKKFWLAMVQGQLYIYDNGWHLANIASGDTTEPYKQSLRGYKTGGLADFTGPAWLDGTPSKPEYILNANQTERFFSLVDVLEGIDKNKGVNQSSGDNYFDIEINVEKLENDYDVEQVANKIRRMIYDDATYRNVNAINHIR